MLTTINKKFANDCNLFLQSFANGSILFRNRDAYNKF